MNTSIMLGIALLIAASGWCAAIRVFVPAKKRLLHKCELSRERSRVISVFTLLLGVAPNLYCARAYLVLEGVSVYVIVSLAGTTVIGPVFDFLGHAFFLFFAQQLPKSDATDSDENISPEK